MAEGIVGCHLVSVLCLVVQLGVPLDVADNVPSPEEDAQRPDGVRLLEEDVDGSLILRGSLPPTHIQSRQSSKGAFLLRLKRLSCCRDLTGVERRGSASATVSSCPKDRRGPARFLAFEDCPHKYLTSFLSQKFRIQKS